MPVRDAIRRLTAERAIEVLDNKRVRIPPTPTSTQAQALRDARLLLEVEAALRAMPNLNASRLAWLRNLGSATPHGSSGSGAAIAVDLIFHRALYAQASEDVLLPLIESIWLQVGPALNAARGARPEVARVDRHASILDAIAARDRRAVGIAIGRDIGEVMEPLVAPTSEMPLSSLRL